MNRYESLVSRSVCWTVDQIFVGSLPAATCSWIAPSSHLAAVLEVVIQFLSGEVKTAGDGSLPLRLQGDGTF